MKKLFSKLIGIFYTPKDSKNAVKWGLYKRVFHDIAKPQLKLLFTALTLTIIASGAEAMSITLIKQVMDEGFLQKNMQILYAIGLQIVALYTAKSLFGYLGGITMGIVGLRAGTYLRRRLFKKMVSLNLGYIQQTSTGRLMNYYGVEAAAVLNVATKTIVDVIKNFITVFIMLGLMIYYAPQMLFLILGVAVFILLPIMVIMKKMRKITKKGFKISVMSTSHINQIIQGIRTVQSYCREKLEVKKMYTIEDEIVKNSFNSIKTSGLQTPILETLIGIMMCFALIMGGYYISTGAMTTGDFLAFLLATTAAYKPLKSLTSIGGAVQAGMIGAETIYNFLDEKPQIKDIKDAKTLKFGKMKVKFDDVSFAYNQHDGAILKNINLTVNAGQVCALVGPSGGGKSTMINLIERFYDVSSGKIEINGTDIRDYSLESLRNNISEVSQDVFLFNGTIADNIRYGKLDATMKEIENAAKLANAHDFIMEMPDAYETEIGEKGTRLSGGQKQRIAIARALLKNAPILLLDEATSALDTQSEKLIQSALNNLMKGRTTFVIAHRLSTILDSDIICVIREGQILERGTHKELLKIGGVYKHLYDIQFASENQKKK